MSTKMNINLATLEDLQQVHGIGPATAHAIMDMRFTKGTLTVEDIQEFREDKYQLIMDNFYFATLDFNYDTEPDDEDDEACGEAATQTERPVDHPSQFSSSSLHDTGVPSGYQVTDVKVVKDGDQHVTDSKWFNSVEQVIDSAAAEAATAIETGPSIQKGVLLPKKDRDDLFAMVNNIKKQREDDRRMFEERLAQMGQLYKLQQKEQEDRYEALRQRADEERGKLERTIIQERQMRANLVKQPTKNRLPATAEASFPEKHAVKPTKPVCHTDSYYQNGVANLAMDYDQQITQAEGMVNQLRMEKDSRLKQLDSMMHPREAPIVKNIGKIESVSGLSPIHPVRHNRPLPMQTLFTNDDTPTQNVPEIGPTSNTLENLAQAVDNRAPKGIYLGGPPRATSTAPPYYQDYNPRYQDYNRGNSSHHSRPSIQKPPLTQDARQNISGHAHGQPQTWQTRSQSHHTLPVRQNITSQSEKRRTDSLPKLSKYDGTGQWKSFYLQFDTYARIRNLTDQEKLEELIILLKDRAIDFLSCQPNHIRYNFQLAIAKLEQRFGKKDLPETLRVQFSHLKQTIDEPVEEWAERVQRLALEAFVDLPEHFMNAEIVRKFCQGCCDRETAQFASDRNPRSIEEALQIVKAHVENSRAIYGSTKSVRQMGIEHGNEYPTYAVPDLSHNLGQASHTSVDGINDYAGDMDFAVRSMGNPRQQFMNLNQQMKRFEDTVSKKFDQLWQYLKNRDSRTIRDKSPTPPSSPRRGNCYTCGQPGHYQYDCGKQGILKSSGSPGRGPNPDSETKANFSSPTRPKVTFSPLNKNRSSV